ncbi:MAG: preprotein translocase subunit SecE [Candidatus Levybacteria bacterium CG_4_10_14_0_2_um_filter_36_16]|nr:MAG: preprotein translocase subunit SecE [Candidatus Levybacteria bacterium CG2_30_37_29]PIR79617.1 MAG: preprotein translocase subunit SecE [Candidatus Levybacteria bacterium CG10_big_fil_rev_8_21_14_0_10_36_30]PIZ97420.1 MAG: preprotein translocase subunit SecE [Candidatus Levybacteria bacterium CG_4_10_14_0_2_um_filter_36_16]PJA89998.1 MAG: preprotein translocase subunit SecE [Candidatus Levybacteria bacterium CG_4_9_14_3_um_filter_36_7]
MFTFLIEVKSELGKVTWPSRTEVARLTFIVIGITLIVGLYLGGADFIFTKMLELIVR